MLTMERKREREIKEIFSRITLNEECANSHFNGFIDKINMFILIRVNASFRTLLHSIFQHDLKHCDTYDAIRITRVGYRGKSDRLKLILDFCLKTKNFSSAILTMVGEP